MRPLTPLQRRLRDARPGDPSPERARQVAVRVIARMAILEAGQRAAPGHSPRGRVVIAAAALFTLLFPWPGGASHLAPREAVRVAHRSPGEVWTARVEAALAGDTVVRHRILHGGAAARAALLDVAEAGGLRAAEALALLQASGALRGRAETERVARLAADPVLAPTGIDLLARDLGASGLRHLGALLASRRDLAGLIVPALDRAARAGRRRAAFAALLRGAHAGCAAAAAAAVRVGGASELERLVAALPASLDTAPAVLRALSEAPPTVRARLARLAASGTPRMLALAARVRAPGIVERLAVEAQGSRRERAERAASLLAMQESVAADLALARAVDGRAGRACRQALHAMGEDRAQALAHHARVSPRDATAALRALAVAGRMGTLRTLSRVPRLAPAVVGALGLASGQHADVLLERLAAVASLRDRAVCTLARRVRAGDHEAGASLLRLARRGEARSVMRALAAEGGDAGRAVLRVAREDARPPAASTDSGTPAAKGRRPRSI